MGWCWGRKYSPGLRSIRSWKNEGRLATIEQHKFFIAEGHSSMTVRNTRCRVRLCDPSHQGTLPDIYQTPWPNGTVGRRRGIFKAKEINLRIFSLLSRVSQALGSRHWQCCVRQFPNFFQPLRSAATVASHHREWRNRRGRSSSWTLDEEI